jgi:hypothetical protein
MCGVSGAAKEAVQRLHETLLGAIRRHREGLITVDPDVHAASIHLVLTRAKSSEHQGPRKAQGQLLHRGLNKLVQGIIVASFVECGWGRT